MRNVYWITGWCFICVLLGLMSAGCGKMSTDAPARGCQSTTSGPVTVAISMGRGSGSQISIETGEETRSSIGPDGAAARWDDSDRILLWARSYIGVYAIDGEAFSVLANGDEESIFTATLPQAMAEGSYTYYACYPEPVSLSSTTAVFNLPPTQGGKASGGEDIMVSAPVSGGALKQYMPEQGTGLKMHMEHLLHLLRFYLPAGSEGLKGKDITRIVARFPGNVAGIVTKDITSDAAATLSDGVQEIELVLDEPLAPSETSTREYACATIFPTEFGEGAEMELTLYADGWVGKVNPISIEGRNFQAGHATDVCLRPVEASPYFPLKFILSDNNLGEEVQKITISVTGDGQFPVEGGSRTYVWETGGDIPPGEVLLFNYKDESDFTGMSGRTINVTYDSEHVRCGQSFVLPALSGMSSYTCNLTVPYLLYEDFSSVPSFSSNDASGLSSTGSMSAISFLNGWTGGRVGAQEGNCIRIAGRRECGLWIDAHYPARVDSAPLPQIKSAVDVEVSFDYGTNREYTLSDAVKGQHIYVGYVTSTSAYASGDETGVFEGNTIDTEELSGSWTNLPHRASMVIHDMPAGTENRITWRNDPYSRSEFGANTTSYCYLDNIKVKVKK